MKLYCPKCGTGISGGQFCSFCGARLDYFNADVKYEGERKSGIDENCGGMSREESSFSDNEKRSNEYNNDVNHDDDIFKEFRDLRNAPESKVENILSSNHDLALKVMKHFKLDLLRLPFIVMALYFGVSYLAINKTYSWSTMDVLLFFSALIVFFIEVVNAISISTKISSFQSNSRYLMSNASMDPENRLMLRQKMLANQQRIYSKTNFCLKCYWIGLICFGISVIHLLFSWLLG